MNQLLSVKNLFEPKVMSNGNGVMSDKWLKRSDADEKANDFGKILKQRDRQEKPSKRPENFSQPDKKTETQEDISEYDDKNVQERSALEDLRDEIGAFLVPNEKQQEPENSGWISEGSIALEPQIPENFSTDAVQVTEDETVKDTIQPLEQNVFVAAVNGVQPLKPVADVSAKENKMDDLRNLATDRVDLPEIKSESTTTAISDKATLEEKPQNLESRIEPTKMTLKMAKAISAIPKSEVKTPATMPTLNAQSFDIVQNASNLLNLQHFDVRDNIGIKSARKGDERKGGFVSSLSTVLTESEDPLHRESASSSNGSRVAEVLSQKNDTPFFDDLEQHFESREAVLPQVQPKVVVNTYEAVQQDRIETIQGMIATLEQQMDEMKRARRNSVIVKVDLENGESLNCQVTLTRSDVAIRFPALEESFKTQILNHWEALRKFAQTRQLNLEEPHFIVQTSL